MREKKIFTFILLLILSFNSVAQINVGSIEHVKLKPGKITKNDVEDLKKSKTIFYYSKKDKKMIEQFSDEIKKAWTLTELEFVQSYSYSDLINNTEDTKDTSVKKEVKKENINYSYFKINRLYNKVTTTNSDGNKSTNEYLYFYLTLKLKIGDEEKTFCRIELDPTFDTYSKFIQNYGTGDFYNVAVFRNWELGFLKNALQFVNNQLEKQEVSWLYKTEKLPEIKKVKNDTLYIPHYIFYKFGKFTGNEGKTHEIDNLFKKYKYPYKVVMAEELSKMILESDKPLYYLIYVKSCTNKYIYVMNSKSGSMPYRKYKKLSYNIKSKDIRKLAKAVK